MSRWSGWRIFAGCLIVILPLALYAIFITHGRSRQERLSAAETVNRMFTRSVALYPGIFKDASLLSERLKEIEAVSGTQALFITQETVSGSHVMEPEIQSAMKGTIEENRRFSNELKKDACFLAFPVVVNGVPAGFLQVMLDPEAVDDGRDARRRFYLAFAVTISALLAAVWSLVVNASFTRKLKGLSGYLGELSSRFLEAPQEGDFGDEIERVSARARSLADRILETMDMLKDEKEKVRAIIEHMDDGVALLDGQTRILLYNAAFTMMFAIPRGTECIGKPVREVVRNPHLLDAIGQYAISQTTVRREIAVVGGTGMHISAVVFPFLHDSPQKRTLLVLHDITQQKKIEEMRVDFVANASHELKTPLTAIRGFVETMSDGAVDDPKTAKQFLAIIQKHTERLTRLVDDLLTLSNIELGKDKPELSTVAVESIIKSVEQVLQQSIENSGIKMTRHVDADAAAVDADRDRLVQVLLNLVDNAVKYTPRGGEVATRCRRLVFTRENAAQFDYPRLDGNPLLPETADGWSRAFIEFSVSDTGEGIPAQSIPRLMERFYRVDNARSRERGGTGLGLSIVKHLVIAHGGSIKIESEPGKGTCVRFIIPERRKVS